MTISTDDLEKKLGDSSLKVLDCSAQMGLPAGECVYINYLKQHIKGAQFFDTDYFKDQASDLPFMMPSEKQFKDAMKRMGIKIADSVVCYDAGVNQFFGYRAAWMLQAMGHPNVSVLDGGLPKWISEGKKVDAHDQAAQESDFDYKVDTNKLKILDDMTNFELNPAASGMQVLDARPSDQYSAGKITGSANFTLDKIWNENKTMKNADERKAAFEAAGVKLD